MFSFTRKSQQTYVLMPFDTAMVERAHPAEPKRQVIVMIPTDLILCAWRQVFPAERMVMLGGRRTKSGVRVTSMSDVTETEPSPVHVRADAARLAMCLLDLERAGAHLAVWMHSHPGEGAVATHPSGIDIRQEEGLRRHYTGNLVSIIVTRDGCLRVWGSAVAQGAVKVRWVGSGVVRHQNGGTNVYQLAIGANV